MLQGGDALRRAVAEAVGRACGGTGGRYSGRASTGRVCLGWRRLDRERDAEASGRARVPEGGRRDCEQAAEALRYTCERGGEGATTSGLQPGGRAGGGGGATASGLQPGARAGGGGAATANGLRKLVGGRDGERTSTKRSRKMAREAPRRASFNWVARRRWRTRCLGRRWRSALTQWWVSAAGRAGLLARTRTRCLCSPTLSSSTWRLRRRCSAGGPRARAGDLRGAAAQR